MMRHTLFLACTSLLVLAGCSDNKPPPGKDMGVVHDLAPRPDLSRSVDMPAPPDMTLLSDLARPQCGHGQDFLNGACGCNASHANSCSPTFCCGTAQSCLSATSCSPPAARLNMGMAYDPLRDRTLVFGGTDENNMVLGDQFALDPLTWDQQVPATVPTPRSGPALAFDGKNLLLLGGISMAGVRNNETWSWNGTTWAMLTTPKLLLSRTSAALAYDSDRKVVVLFGGDGDGDNALDDTWEWNGTSWQQRLLANSPDAREGHAMAYDAKNKKTLVFSGLTLGNYSNDTWLYDGVNWAPQNTDATHTPPMRSFTAAAYDATRQNVVMFGGENPVAPQFNDTWVWDGTKWNKMNPAKVPPGRESHGMVYDAGRKQVLMFGGVHESNGVYYDVWAWDGTNWTQLY